MRVIQHFPTFLIPMKPPAMIAALTACATVGTAAEVFQKTVISARDGVRVDSLMISGRNVTCVPKVAPSSLLFLFLILFLIPALIPLRAPLAE